MHARQNRRRPVYVGDPQAIEFGNPLPHTPPTIRQLSSFYGRPKCEPIEQVSTTVDRNRAVYIAIFPPHLMTSRYRTHTVTARQTKHTHRPEIATIAAVSGGEIDSASLSLPFDLFAYLLHKELALTSAAPVSHCSRGPPGWTGS